MENELISASEAKKFVDAGKSEKDTKNLADVTKKINSAIQLGAYSCTAGEVTESTKRVLTQKGYTVTYMNGDFRDPRDTGYHKISWN